MLEIQVPISVGELVDKITILEIKSRRFDDETKRNHVFHELKLLKGVCTQYAIDLDAEVVRELERINEKLWVIEDDIREKERLKQFDHDFIELARAVYRINDQRFQVKQQVNKIFGSNIVEEKSYRPY